jgi:hypothetical protein
MLLLLHHRRVPFTPSVRRLRVAVSHIKQALATEVVENACC